MKDDKHPLSRMKTILLASLMVLCCMSFYEFIKEAALPELSKWESHIITIFVSLLITALVSNYFIRRRENMMRLLDREMLNLILAEEKVQRLLDDKKILLREVHHRIKNNMMMIASLLEMQAYSAGEEAAALLDASRERVLAMMKVYEYLYRRDDYSEMPLGVYLDELADTVHYAHASSGNILLKKEIETFETGINIIYPIGLIVNELLVNAYKYAFPENQGVVSLFLKEQHPGQLQLTVADNGIGMDPDTAVEKSGFGMNLTRLLTAQISGELKIVNDGGTRITVTAPFQKKDIPASKSP